MARRKDFRRIKTAKIRGRTYKVKWGRIDKGKALGKIDRPQDVGKVLRIDHSTDAVELLGTVLHEILHGSLWDLDEISVTDTEQCFLAFVRRMGIKVTFPGHKPKTK